MDPLKNTSVSLPYCTCVGFDDKEKLNWCPPLLPFSSWINSKRKTKWILVIIGKTFPMHYCCFNGSVVTRFSSVLFIVFISLFLSSKCNLVTETSSDPQRNVTLNLLYLLRGVMNCNGVLDCGSPVLWLLVKLAWSERRKTFFFLLKLYSTLCGCKTLKPL